MSSERDGRKSPGVAGRFFPCSSSSHVSLLYDIPRTGPCLASMVPDALRVCVCVCVCIHTYLRLHLNGCVRSFSSLIFVAPEVMVKRFRSFWYWCAVLFRLACPMLRWTCCPDSPISGHSHTPLPLISVDIQRCLHLEWSCYSMYLYCMLTLAPPPLPPPTLGLRSLNSRWVRKRATALFFLWLTR